MKHLRTIILSCIATFAVANLTAASLHTDTVSFDEMKAIYEEVKTPYKYGMVVAPGDNNHKIDCPMLFRHGDKWLMTYVVYNGSDGLDGRGYETWLAESDNLLEWKTLGRVLSYHDTGWDCNQRAGYPSLIDWTWGGSYELNAYKGKYWMSYFGGIGTGYEAVRAPLNTGIAYTTQDPSKAHEWITFRKPTLSYNERSAQWWEQLTHYKSTVYEDPDKTLGHRFLMFYNAGGINPTNNMKAERIGIAYSDNMRSWKRYKGNPVFSHEASGIITGDAQIVKMGDIYVMFYFSAYNPLRKYNAYNTFAVSRNLVDWQDWSGEDLIYPTKSYDEMFAHKSYVVKWKGVVYHFYCAVNNPGQRGIALATSVPMGKSAVNFPEPQHKGKRTTTVLSEGWTTRLISASDSIAPTNRDTLVSLPHNWDDYYGYRQLKHGNLHGSALYTKTLKVSLQKGKRYFLELQGVGTWATVTLNGYSYKRELVGRTVFTLDITDHLRNGENKLEILTDHPSMMTNVPWACGGCSSEWGFSEGSQPLGIYRPVSLITTDNVRIEPFGVHIWNNAQCDSVFIDTEIHNYSTQQATFELVNKLAFSSGKQALRLSEKVTLAAGESIVVHQKSGISDVKRWSLEDPYLYKLSSMIKRDGKTTDEMTTPYGIRNVSWPVPPNSNDPRFKLNDKAVFINGTCDYEHLFGAGHAFSNEQIKSRIKQIKGAGFNAFREAHQPHNLEYQRLLDQEGLLFWSQFSAHIWYDTPEFRENFKEMMKRWIRERRNSPSVIMWGLQNESVLPSDFAAECVAIIRQMDPTASTMRPITTCNGGSGTDWNVIQNWSGTYGGSAKNYDKELAQSNQLLNGEYGAWRTIGLHATDKNTKSYTEERFCDLLETKMNLAEKAADKVCGHFQWIFTSHDNPGRVQPEGALRRIDKVGPINYKGLQTTWEQPTDGLHLYKAAHVSADKAPMVYIVSHTWADRFAKGAQRADIDVYSNCDSVVLYNGYESNKLGRKRTPPHFVWEKRMIQYNVLRAVGYRHGKVVAEDVVLLPGLQKAPDYDSLYSASRAIPVAADRNIDLLKGSDTHYYIYRVNCGGDTYTDHYGQTWEQDDSLVSHSWAAAFGLNPYQASQGNIQCDPIRGTQDWRLFQTFRFGRHKLNYDFSLPNGEYRVELYFAEPWLGVGAGLNADYEGERLFDVAINGKTMIRDLDLWAEGGYAGAVKRVVNATVKDGHLHLSFPQVKVGQAIISAIAIASKEKPKTEIIIPKAKVSTTMWADFDNDQVEKLAQSELPTDKDEFVSTVYDPVKRSACQTIWNITPGLGKEYALRFSYKNLSEENTTANIQLVDSKGITLIDRDMTFPPTPKKFKLLSTTTGTQINAGHYKLIVTVEDGRKLEFKSVEVQ